MTADFEKDITHCLICNSKVGVSTRSSIRIFNETSVTTSEKPLVDTICTVLEISINEESAHSLVICKKCYKLFNEVDELENRLLEIKQELYNNYQKTVTKISDLSKNEEEYNDHDYINNIENQTIEIELKDTETTDPSNYKENEREFEVVEEIMEERDETGESENMFVRVETIDESKNDQEKKRSRKAKSTIKTEISQEQIVIKDGVMYTCLLCTDEEEKEAVDAKTIITHMKNVHDTRLYICDICGDDFKKRNELSLHLDEHVAKEEGDFQCEICNRIFSNLRLFRIHKRIHYPQVKSWPCETCGKRYRYVCGKAFNSRDNRNAHRFIHSDKKPYECLVCGMGFMRKPLLYAHMQTQGHLNDTIVVNQPRLTTEDDQVIAIPDGNVELLMDETENNQLEEAELYVTELKDHVIIQHQNENQIYNEESVLNIPAEENVVGEEVDQITVDQQINFSERDAIECKNEDTDQVEEVYTYNDNEEGETVVPNPAEYKEIVEEKKNAVRLVQIRFPSSVSEDGRSWLSLVQNT
ncbi:zinc finger protein 724-like [Vespula maculifrons]|uniref:Zinc finger protein 724-like n=1 Tax=Vespula maculifrons TaxID=7453 RepID=A0ABD2BKJ8_VESMC